MQCKKRGIILSFGRVFISFVCSGDQLFYIFTDFLLLLLALSITDRRLLKLLDIIVDLSVTVLLIFAL